MNKIIVLICLMFSMSVFAANKKYGVGLILFGPTGVSGLYNLDSGDSIDAALAWNSAAGQTFNIHSTYLMNKADFLKFEKANFDFHYGVGARIINKDSTQGSNAGTNLGVRVPVGLSYKWNSVPAAAFSEVSVNLNLTPGTSMDFTFALGARYFF